VVERSVGKAISSPVRGLLRRYAPRNDMHGVIASGAKQSPISQARWIAWGLLTLQVGFAVAAGACRERSVAGGSQ